MATITITNISDSHLSIDIPVPAGGIGVGHPKAIRASLAPGGYIDVGEIITIDDLNRTSEFKQLQDTGLISVTAAGESDDVLIPGAELAAHGSAHEQGSTDPISSLPTADQKAALAGTGTPAAGDPYVNDSDGRIPTVDEKAALAGTGTPGAGDPFVNDSDARMSDARTPTDASVTAAKMAVADAAGLGGLSVIRKPFAAGGGGAPDDVAIYTADAPFDFQVLDVTAIIATNVGGSTVTLRDTAGGAGTALSDALDSATTGVKRNSTLTATGGIAAGGSLVIRRSDSGIAGELIVLIQKT